MYLDFFGLREHAFTLNSDPRFLYLSKAHARARSYMEYALVRSDGLVVITGGVGCGKTTLIRDVFARLDSKVVRARIHHSQLNELEFLQALALELGLRPGRSGKIQLLAKLTKFLTDEQEQGRGVLLVVDDAQNLGPRVLEEIRLLSDVEFQKQKIVNFILVGQPRLDETLDSVGLEQLAQRIRLRYRLDALNPQDTESYIKYRLHIAGNTHDTIFTPQCFALIYKYTGGVPRLINVLCDFALTAAFLEEAHQVSADIIRTAIEELQWVTYSRRPGIETSTEQNLVSARTFSLKSIPEYPWLIRDGISKIMVVIREDIVPFMREKAMTGRLGEMIRAVKWGVVPLWRLGVEKIRPINQAWRRQPLTPRRTILVAMGIASAALAVTYFKGGLEELAQETAQVMPEVATAIVPATESQGPQGSQSKRMTSHR